MRFSLARRFLLLAVTLPAAAFGTSIPPVEIYFGIGTPAPEQDHAVRGVRRAIREAPRHVGANVMYIVAGHTDRAGTEEANVQLSCERAQAVRVIFVAEGVPAADIVIQAFGETRPAVDTDDGITEPLNRRVEITYQPRAERLLQRGPCR